MLRNVESLAKAQVGPCVHGQCDRAGRIRFDCPRRTVESVLRVRCPVLGPSLVDPEDVPFCEPRQWQRMRGQAIHQELEQIASLGKAVRRRPMAQVDGRQEERVVFESLQRTASSTIKLAHQNRAADRRHDLADQLGLAAQNNADAFLEFATPKCGLGASIRELYLKLDIVAADTI